VPVNTGSNASSEGPAAVVGPNDLRTDSAPGIFTLSPGGQGAVVIAGTGLIARATKDAFSRPARRGEVVEIYCTGLGAVTNPPLAGQPASATQRSQTLGTAIVTIGSLRTQVLFSGLAPGLAGVYQVDARVPADSPVGTSIPVTVNVNEQGLLSNTVTIAIAE